MGEKNRAVLSSLIIPLIVHIGVVFLVQAVFDTARISVPALPVTVADCLCIPVFLSMIRSDREKGNNKMNCMLAGKNKIFFLAGSFVIGAVFSFLAGNLMEILGLYRMFSNAAQEELYSASLWLQLAGLCIAVPVSEELLYRGLVFPRMCEIFPVRAAAVGSAALFAVGHGNLIQALYAFPMGLLLAWCRKKGGPGAGIACHIGANFLAVCLNLC